MPLPRDVEAALARYKRSLEDLTFNSKPLIDDLTRAAGQLEPKGDQIVEVIQSRIMQVRPEWKLPSLYLLDSIMKNLKGSYLEHISRVIVGVFCHCFEKLTDPEARKSLYKLRTTWPPFLPQHKLAAIDRHVHALDPNWPVVALDSDPTSPSIYVNPKFVEGQSQQAASTSIQERRKAVLKQTKQEHQQRQQQDKGLPTVQAAVNEGKKKEDKQQQKQEKAKVASLSPQRGSRTRSASPLPLSTSALRANKSASPPHTRPDSNLTTTTTQDTPPAKRIKVEKESNGNKKSSSDKYSEPIKKSHLQLDDLPPELLPKHHENMLKRIERQINAGGVTPEQRATLVNQLNQLYELQKLKSSQQNHCEVSRPPPVPLNHLPVHHPQNNVKSLDDTMQPPAYSSQEPPPRHPGPRVRSTYPAHRGGREGPSRPPWSSDHMETSRESHPLARPQDLSQNDEPGSHPLKVPNLSLTPATLKQRYSSVIALLHSGDPCSSCGLRFLSSAGDLYRLHLNWHYKINREEKEGQGKTSRNWFLHPDDWFNYTELADDAAEMSLKQPKKESPTSFPSEKSTESKQEMESSSVRAGDASEIEVCVVCNEPFEQFWEEEEEAWHFRDAVRIGPNSRLYHTYCYKAAPPS